MIPDSEEKKSVILERVDKRESLQRCEGCGGVRVRGVEFGCGGLGVIDNEMDHQACMIESQEGREGEEV